jgi:hypothetical protein
MNLIWSLKSYYHYADVDYPLTIHDGGLLPAQKARLREHFPDAQLVERDEALARVTAELERRGLTRCAAFRRINVFAPKLIDIYLEARADHVVYIDSDVVFFRRPDLLIVPPGGTAQNRYNRDAAEGWYTMSPEELEEAFGVRPLPRVNAGLSIVRRTSMDFEAIERWLDHPRMLNDGWLSEQTLHALCASASGAEILPPDVYRLDTQPGLSPETVCKHYPSYFRPLLYAEGMATLVRAGFLEELGAARTVAAEIPQEL